MTFITAQQTKLDLKLRQLWNSVYKHRDFYRFKIDKKKRFNLTLEVFRDIFQICPRIEDQDFDAIPSKEDIVSFLRELRHTRVINSLNDVVINQMHQPWRTFAALINRSLSGKTIAFDKLRLSRAHILWGMYYQKNVDYDDYLINTLRFVSRKEASHKYGAVLPEYLTSPQMKESKAYKTYLSYATSIVPPKVAKKFKKASPYKKESDLVPADEEPIIKGKRVKRLAKNSTTALATCIIIREPSVETQSKRKEKVDVAHGKGINLLSKVAPTEEAQMKEFRKKSLRNFHKSHPSGSGSVAEKPPRVEKITPTVTNEGTGDKPGVPGVTKDDSTESESESWDNDEDDNNDEEGKEDIVHTLSNSDDEDEKLEGDEEKGMNDTTGEGADAEMYDTHQGNENLVTTHEQVVDYVHVTITKKTDVPVTSSCCSLDLASKFLNFLDMV
nr:hypothetical protein [Tanacetum cinerariifolium]